LNLLNEANIKIPGPKTFNRTILPDFINKVKRIINQKLNVATIFVLIVDIWSNSQMTDFMGLDCMISNEHFEKECFVIGLERMPGSHNAENIKATIESIINKFEFDRTKISGND
jgi:hypothetical protein